MPYILNYLFLLSGKNKHVSNWKKLWLKVFQAKLVSSNAAKPQYFMKILENKSSIGKICNLVFFKIYHFQIQIMI